MLQNTPSTPQKISAKLESASSLEDFADLSLFHGVQLTPEQQQLMDQALAEQFGHPQARGDSPQGNSRGIPKNQ